MVIGLVLWLARAEQDRAVTAPPTTIASATPTSQRRRDIDVRWPARYRSQGFIDYPGARCDAGNTGGAGPNDAVGRRRVPRAGAGDFYYRGVQPRRRGYRTRQCGAVVGRIRRHQPDGRHPLSDTTRRVDHRHPRRPDNDGADGRVRDELKRRLPVARAWDCESSRGSDEARAHAPRTKASMGCSCPRKFNARRGDYRH